MIKDEETWVTLVLALMQVRVTYLKGQEKPKEATSRDQKKTPRQRARATTTSFKAPRTRRGLGV